MTNEEIIKEVLEQIITELPRMHIDNRVTDRWCKAELAYKILSLSGLDWELAIVKKKPELPENLCNKCFTDDRCVGWNCELLKGYNQAQQDMLKAGFRQEVK